MSNQVSVSSRVLAFLLPAILGLSCVERDWSFCSPQDKCQTGYTCTADWRCVRDVDGGADGLVAVDSNGTADQAIGTDSPAVPDAAAIGRDAAAPDSVSSPPDAALSTRPDGPEPDAAPLTASPDAPVDTRPDSPAYVAPDAPAPVPDAPATGGPADAPSADAPFIGPTVDAAGSCSADKDCSSQNPLCLGNRCAKCSRDSDCEGRTGTLACEVTSGLCVACTANKHCIGAAGTCDTTTNQCVGCVTRNDCAGACLTCSSAGVCMAVKNQDDPGVCVGTCDSTGACKSKQGQSCQTVAAGCAAGTTCSPDGVCCNSTCDQACHSCLGSKTGGVDGTCANETTGTVCGSGQYCNAGICGNGCLIGGTLYASGAASSTNPCQTCQPSVSPTSWSPLGNGTVCGSGRTCSAGICQCTTGTDCGTSGCINVSGSDSSHCGSCTNVCPAGQSCNSGKCACTTGAPACGGCLAWDFEWGSSPSPWSLELPPDIASVGLFNGATNIGITHSQYMSPGAASLAAPIEIGGANTLSAVVTVSLYCTVNLSGYSGWAYVYFAGSVPLTDWTNQLGVKTWNSSGMEDNFTPFFGNIPTNQWFKVSLSFSSSVPVDHMAIVLAPSGNWTGTMYVDDVVINGL